MIKKNNNCFKLFNDAYSIKGYLPYCRRLDIWISRRRLHPRGWGGLVCWHRCNNSVVNKWRARHRIDVRPCWWRPWCRYWPWRSLLVVTYFLQYNYFILYLTSEKKTCHWRKMRIHANYIILCYIFISRKRIIRLKP